MTKSASALIIICIGIGAAVVSSTASDGTIDQPVVAPFSSPRITAEGQPFVDRFDQLDPALWSISDGWTNGPYMVNDWRKRQVAVDQGVLIALERKSDASRGYSSGEIQSRNVFGHGYYEVTMQAASGSGVISGFFTYTGPPFGKPWNEIDVEILGKNTRRAQLTYFYRGDSKVHTVDLPFDAALSPHHYAFDWQPGFIRWYIDGQLVHEATGNQLTLPDHAQKIMVHLWGTDTAAEWAGPFDQEAVPTYMRIECVAYSAIRAGEDKCRLKAEL